MQSTTYTSMTTIAGPDTIDTANGATITVANTANVTYLASGSIRLGPGFTATAGSSFHAVIGTDTSAPTVPGNPGTSAANATSLTFSWSAASDNVGVTGYEVAVGGNLYDTTAGTSLVVAGLAPSTTYSFSVQARDAAGNGSGWSGAVNGTTTSGADTTRPSTPGNVHVTAFDQSSVTFAWDAASDNVGVTGYWVRVNQGTAQLVPGLSHTFPGLASNTSHLLEVSARDAAGNTSQTWGSTSATTSGNDPNGSVWLDVDGDGIRDEIVRPRTDSFEYAIGEWYTPVVQYYNHPLNNFWNAMTMFYALGTEANDFGWEFNDSAAQYYITWETRFGLVFYIMLDAHEPYKVYRDLTDSDQLNPANWEYIFGSDTGPAYSTQHEFHWDVPNPFQLVNSKYFVVKYGQSVAKVQVKDSAGTTLTTSPVDANGVATVNLPANGQLQIPVYDTNGNEIKVEPGKHTLSWIIEGVANVAGNVINGIGKVLDMANVIPLPNGQLVVRVKLDNSSEYFTFVLVLPNAQPGFVKMWESKNKANQIYNPALKDDPWGSGGAYQGQQNGAPRNKLYMVVDPVDGRYRVSLAISVAQQFRSRMVAAAYTWDGPALQHVPGSDSGFTEESIANLSFEHFDSLGEGTKPYFVRVGYDEDNDGHLDMNEAQQLTVTAGLGEPTAWGCNEATFASALAATSSIIDGGISGATEYVLPHAKRFLQIFRDGGFDTLPEDKKPTSTALATIDVFTVGNPISSTNMAEWLTHNSGLYNLTESGTATYNEYTWNSSSSTAQLLASSTHLRMTATRYYQQVVASSVEAHFNGLEPGSSLWFPREPGNWYRVDNVAVLGGYEHESPAEVPKTTITFGDDLLPDDLRGTIGRGRLLLHEAQFRVEKRFAPAPATYEYALIEVVHRGEVRDLYDWNYEIEGTLQTNRKAAILQIGYGKGAYGSARNYGKIYRSRIVFDGSVPPLSP